jgi:hypothetical protein
MHEQNYKDFENSTAKNKKVSTLVKKFGYKKENAIKSRPKRQK